MNREKRTEGEIERRRGDREAKREGEIERRRGRMTEI